MIDSLNPFAKPSTLEYELPPFERIMDEHYLPAFYAGMAEQLSEVAAIIASGTPTFDNTLVAMEKSGQLLHRVSAVFDNISASDSSPTRDAIEEEISPTLAAHFDAIYLNVALFERVNELYKSRDLLNLDAEEFRLLKKYYEKFIDAGAALTFEQRKRLMEINKELSNLSTSFARHLLQDTNNLAVAIDSIDELDGLSEFEIASLAQAAKDRGFPDRWLITQLNFSGHPLLASMKDRALRQKIYEASLVKGNRDNDDDTKEILVAMARLRAERANLFGKRSHADLVTSNQTAGSPENIHAMLDQLTPAAIRNAKQESSDLQEAIKVDGYDFALEAWDWAYYTEKVRLTKFDIDTEGMKPFFELNNVLHNGLFYAATKLFGLSFKERRDLVTYHSDAQAFEVFNEDGSKLGLFIVDFYTRDSKRGGAWMNNLVDQSYLFNKLPVVVNNLNISKPPVNDPTLLTLSEVTTVFHEFGHALHGLFSAVKYPLLSGTNVERDFVEFPSQVNEMWIFWPEVVANYALHYKTGERIPQEWLDRVESSETFNQGFETTAYLAATVLDLAFHEISPEDEIVDVAAFEAVAIKEYGLGLAVIPPRYRSTYFSHIFAGGYSSGYYGYIWSEVFDAETVDWFKENGGLSRANGDHFRNQLLSLGGSVDSREMIRKLLGRDATIQPLLKRRGLL